MVLLVCFTFSPAQWASPQLNGPVQHSVYKLDGDSSLTGPWWPKGSRRKKKVIGAYYRILGGGECFVASKGGGGLARLTCTTVLIVFLAICHCIICSGPAGIHWRIEQKKPFCCKPQGTTGIIVGVVFNFFFSGWLVWLTKWFLGRLMQFLEHDKSTGSERGSFHSCICVLTLLPAYCDQGGRFSRSLHLAFSLAVMGLCFPVVLCASKTLVVVIPLNCSPPIIIVLVLILFIVLIVLIVLITIINMLLPKQPCGDHFRVHPPSSVGDRDTLTVLSICWIVLHGTRGLRRVRKLPKYTHGNGSAGRMSGLGSYGIVHPCWAYTGHILSLVWRQKLKKTPEGLLASALPSVVPLQVLKPCLQISPDFFSCLLDFAPSRR